jgi:hypothetical protein
MNFVSRSPSHIEFSRHVRKKRLADPVLRRLRKEDSPRSSENVVAHALQLVRLRRVLPKLERLRRSSASDRNARIHVRRVARLLKVRVQRSNARVLRQEKTLENVRFSAAKKTSERKISSASVLQAQIDRKSVSRRAMANAVLVNSADLKAAVLVRHGPLEETSASVHLAAIDHHVVNSNPTLAVTVHRARRLAIVRRASVLANRPNVSNVKVHSRDALLEEIVRRAKAASVVQTREVAEPAQEVVARAAVDLVVAAHDRVARVQVDHAQLVRDPVARNLVARAAAEEARDLHFVAISFSDTLIRGTYLFLCRRSPNLYRSA